MAQGEAPAQTKEEKSVRADAESADCGADADSGADADAASAIRIVIIPSLFPSPSAPAASSKKVFFFSLSCPRF